MEKIDDQHSRMMIADRQFRVFESFYWNSAERVARLDEEGIAVQVISPLPELLSYWLAPGCGRGDHGLHEPVRRGHGEP